jgi:hypothetical protein
MLGVLAVAFAVVAVVDARAGVPDRRRGSRWGTGRSRRMSGHRLLGCLQVQRSAAAAKLSADRPDPAPRRTALIGVGLWQMFMGNGATGVRLMRIAVGDLLLVGAVARRDSDQASG